MVGYPEALTDPSYRGQMLVSTFPLVGNYGVPDPTAICEVTGLHKYVESDQIHVSAYLVSEYCDTPSHWNSKMTLSQWLRQEKVPGIYGLDTRLLTKKIRETGSMLARIEFEPRYTDGTGTASTAVRELNPDHLFYISTRARNFIHICLMLLDGRTRYFTIQTLEILWPRSVARRFAFMVPTILVHVCLLSTVAVKTTLYDNLSIVAHVSQSFLGTTTSLRKNMMVGHGQALHSMHTLVIPGDVSSF